jgi:hypothetical protein
VDEHRTFHDSPRLPVTTSRQARLLLENSHTLSRATSLNPEDPPQGDPSQSRNPPPPPRAVTPPENNSSLSRATGDLPVGDDPVPQATSMPRWTHWFW